MSLNAGCETLVGGQRNGLPSRRAQWITGFCPGQLVECTRSRASTSDGQPSHHAHQEDPSKRVEAGLEQAELISLGVGKDVPRLLAGLADVGRARPELQEALKLGVLIAVGGVDVDM